jgi:hypothetical protein
LPINYLVNRTVEDGLEEGEQLAHCASRQRRRASLALIIPVAAIALALSAAGGLAQTGGASGTSGGAAAKSGSDATAPMAIDPKAKTSKSMAKGKKKKTMKKSAG